MRRIKKSAEFLLETGLLFEINRQVLHPLGLALEIKINEENGKIDFGDILDCREDLEGIIFDPETFVEGKERYEKYLEAYGNTNLNFRLSKLGFKAQEK